MNGDNVALPHVRMTRDAETGRARIVLISQGFDLLTEEAAERLGRELIAAARYRLTRYPDRHGGWMTPEEMRELSGEGKGDGGGE